MQTDEDEYLNRIEMAREQIADPQAVHCPTCHCKLQKKYVKRNTANKGRPFMVCEDCQDSGRQSWFFWLDNGVCSCGAPWQASIVKKPGVNQGRHFRTCPGCGLFRWEK